VKIKFAIKLLNCNKIPSTYRKNFVSLIKEAFVKSENNNIRELNKTNNQKPFTFSVKFKLINVGKDQLELKENVFDFYFSTSEYLILISVYNFILKNLDSYNIFPNCKNILIRPTLIPQIKIDKSTAVFKTLSPIVVRDMINKNGDRTLKFNDIGFENNLKLSIKSSIKTFTKNDIDHNSIDIKILKMKADNINNYGNNKNLYGLYANSGLIEVNLQPDYLQLLYDIGIGAKRSQGFGMVEKIL